MRSKENLVLIEPHEGILIAYSLYYQEELRGIEEIPERDAVMSKTVETATLEMAKQLILNLSGKWDASKYRDEYNEIIMGVIKRKADPLAQPIQEAPKAQPAKVINLMDALKAAVEATGRAKAVNE
jgi:DNA end-binding protein Ku